MDNNFNIGCRNFLLRSSMAAVFTMLLKNIWGQTTDFVIAETSFGKVRGTTNRGIKVFKGKPVYASQRFRQLDRREGCIGIWAHTAKNRETMGINNESKVVNDPIREQRIAMFDVLKYT